MKDFVRTLIARLLTAALVAGGRPLPLSSGPAVVFAPHADDETLGCGGIIALKAARGELVQVVFLTDSSGSHADHPALSPATLARRRREEACAALDELGLPAERAHFLEAPDGRLDRLTSGETAALQDRLAALLDDCRPTAVFLPLLGDGSTEHDAAHHACLAALRFSGLHPVVWEYPIWAWWNPLRLRRQVFHPAENFHLELGPLRARKQRALACHATQVAPVPPRLEPALPPVLGRLCTGPHELFFQRNS